MVSVTNLGNQHNPDTVRKLIKNKQCSTFEMVNICIKIETTRDIARQILRHKSFTFQEFSQKYDEVSDFEYTAVRIQDKNNPQNSIETEDKELQCWWMGVQHRVRNEAEFMYTAALRKGVAKEVACKLLPEGLMVSRMYVNGTLGSWLQYLSICCNEATQKEHRDVALLCKAEIAKAFPSILEVLND